MRAAAGAKALRSAWLAAIAGVMLATGCAPAVTPATTDADAATQEPPPGFAWRRAILLAIAPGPVDEDTPQGPWLSGVVAETRQGDSVSQVSAHTDGTSAVDTLDQPILVGVDQVAAVHAANEAFLDVAFADLDHFGLTLRQPRELIDALPSTAPPYPPDGHVQFFALTDRGLQATLPVPVATIEADPSHPLRALHDAARVARAAILANQPAPRRMP